MIPAGMDISRPIVGAILEVARHNEPETFSAFFCGGVIANVLGNLPEDYWQKFRQIEPCDQPGCDCHLLRARTLPFLEMIRADYQATMAARGKPVPPVAEK